MVQVGAQADYDQDGYDECEGEDEPQERGARAEALQAAVKAFGNSVGEASSRLRAAAEAYVSESVRILDDFAARAERSAEASREAAESAGRAAQEAQQAREAVGVVVFAANDQVVADSRKVIEEATACSEQSVAASREAAAAAEQAAQEARAAAEAAVRASETIAALEPASAGPETREILDRLEADYSLLAQLVKELNDRMSTMTAAASGGEVVGESAAAEGEPTPKEDEPESRWEPTPFPTVASFAPSEAPAAAYEPSWGAAAESEPAMAAPAPEGAPEAPWTEAEAPVAPLAVVDAESWPPAPEEAVPEDELPPEDDAVDLMGEDAPVDALREPLRPAQDGAQEEPKKGLREAAPLLEGSFQLTISPVPDFDRLLSLDAALGRLARVRSVTLADYARDEVTFRVEVGHVTDGEELASELAEASRQALEVVSTTPARLELRVTGARS